MTNELPKAQRNAELRLLLDDFLKKFSKLSMEEQMDFIHETTFLDSIYSMGWDDSYHFYYGIDEEN